MNIDNSDHVVLLGTKGGPAVRTGSSMPTSQLLQLSGEQIVVDCGLGVTRGLVDAGFDLKALNLIFITHLHSDHYLELGPLIHTAWTAGLSTPVTVFGPQGIDDYLTAFLKSMEADIHLRIKDEGRPDLESMITVHAIDEGILHASDQFEVTAIRNIHPPLLDTFALRFEAREKSVVFSGDTAFMPALTEFAKGAELLVHEAMLTDALAALVARVPNGDERLLVHLKRSHTPAAKVGEIAKGADVKRLAINHKVPADDPAITDETWEREIRKEWDGALYIGADGMKIAF